MLDPSDIQRCRALARESDAVREIAGAVAEETGIPVGQILGKSRSQHVAHARQLVYFIASRQGVTPADIARAMRRDHSTVLHGIAAETARRAEASA